MRRERKIDTPVVEPRVELVYDRGCPHAAAARARILLAFKEAGATPRWKEWVRQDRDTPPYIRRYGSPTILVNGKAVSEAVHGDGKASCPVYADEGEALQGIPSISRITAALQGREDPFSMEGGPSSKRAGYSLFLAVVPGLLAGFLPRLA